MRSLDPELIQRSVREALSEDLGLAGDITSMATISGDQQSRASIVAKQPGVIAGVELAVEAFCQRDDRVRVATEVADGAEVQPGEEILWVEGPARALLSAERVALNFLGHLSGIATATHQLVRAIDGTNARVVCTRKTTPGLRALEKYAVRCGGGFNHRFGLFDAVMIKDNHIVASGGITNAVQKARSTVGHLVKIEVEVTTIEQLNEALAAGAETILLDNMSPVKVAECVKIAAGRATLEASGNISLATVRSYAETGVDVISSGWITHSAPRLDLSLEFCG